MVDINNPGTCGNAFRELEIVILPSTVKFPNNGSLLGPYIMLAIEKCPAIGRDAIFPIL